MIKYTDKKWVLIQQIYGGKWGVPDINLPWTNDTNISLAKMLRATGDHFANQDVDLDADIYILVLFGTEDYEQKIEFIKKVKAKGAKVILCVSSDMRFLTGEGLLSGTGLNYTHICEQVDMIWSQVPSHVKLYGRYQHKVIDVGVMLEHVNFSLPYEQRDIDILLSGSIFRNEATLSFALEIMMMLKEKYPDKRVVYPTQYKSILQPIYPQIEFINASDISFTDGLVPLLKRAKYYINPELRPNAGRAMVESYYCRTPYVCSSLSFPSRYYPDFTYDCMSLEHIVNQYERMLNSDREEIIRKSEQLAEEDYFDKAIIRVMERLYS
jgi:hypothetical protein